MPSTNMNYICKICENQKPDQKSHNTSHKRTNKHKLSVSLLRLQLQLKTEIELEDLYSETDINTIITNQETFIMSRNNDDDEEYEENYIISNRDALKDKIHEIHNYLRNHGAGYGMSALKVFNVFYGLMKIDQTGLFEQVGLSEDCRFSSLVKIAETTHDGETLVNLIDNILKSIDESDISYFLHYDIPQNLTEDTYAWLIKEINNITDIEKKCNVLLSGKIYEYFVGRDLTAISDLGAYFSDRHLTSFCINRANPTINEDGSIPSMIDMFGGSGGFTTGYINYMIEKYPGVINWKTEINKISHFDMNEDVIKSAGLEFFCLTGEIPNRDYIKYKNSFTDQFESKKYKYILTNPPYGGDKNTKSDSQKKRDKVKAYIEKELSELPNTCINKLKKVELQQMCDDNDIEYTRSATNKVLISKINECLGDSDDPNIQLRLKREKQLKAIKAIELSEKKDQETKNVTLKSCSNRINKFAKEHNKLSGNDKEACSLMLFMDMVEVGGTVVGILKEGVAFDKKYTQLRKCLVENYNVREIISIPADQFENTSTKTSIFIFDNLEDVTTTTVIFSDLIVYKYTEDTFKEINGNIEVVDNEGDIKDVAAEEVSRGTRDEILNNSIGSLNGKDYNKREIVCGDDYKLVKLGDICEIKYGTRITKENNTIGDVPVYGGGDITFYTNKTNRDPNTLIISRYAMSKHCVRLIHSNFYLNDSGLSIHNNDNQLQLYINYLLLSNHNQGHIYKFCTSGSIQRNVNMNLFKKLQLPIPKSPEKISYWVDRISTPYNEKIQKQNRIKELETFVQDRIKEIGENEECDEVELGNICEIKGGETTPEW